MSIRQRLHEGETLYWRSLSPAEKQEVYRVCMEVNPFCPDYYTFATYMEWVADGRP